jgi:hypothetical protein
MLELNKSHTFFPFYVRDASSFVAKTTPDVAGTIFTVDHNK